MNHPSVVTLESRSVPRVLLAGEQLIPVMLPVGTRCIYPNPALQAFSDIEGMVRAALSHPLDSAPLPARLRPGMRLTLVVANPWDPPPAGAGSDIRSHLLRALLAVAVTMRVSDIEILIGAGFERRLKPGELRRLVGPRIFKEFFPARLHCHDAEDTAGLVQIGVLADGTPVEVNRRVVDSDLTIVVAVRTTQTDDIQLTMARGLSSYRTWRGRPHREPLEAVSSGRSVPRAEGARAIGRVIQENLPLFSIEAVLPLGSSSPTFSVLTKNEDDLSERERLLQRTLLHSAHRFPELARRWLGGRDAVHASVIGVWAGNSALVNEASVAKVWQQCGVSVTGQADVLVLPIPPTSSGGVRTFLNPLLAQALGAGHYFNMHRGKPLLRPGGTLVLLHPMTDRFDHEAHVASLEFVHSFLAETREPSELARDHEPRFSRDPALIQMYRSSYADHPAHPFSLWYAGESGRRHAGRVIVVGADNESIPALFGFETAATMDDALYRARGGIPRSLDVICLKDPALLLSDVA